MYEQQGQYHDTEDFPSDFHIGFAKCLHKTAGLISLTKLMHILQEYKERHTLLFLPLQMWVTNITDVRFYLATAMNATL